MKKSLLGLLLVIGFGFWLGPRLKEQSSYVLIEWNLYSIETTVPFLLVLLCGLLILLFGIFWLVRWLLRSGGRVWGFRSRHRLKQRDKRLTQATLAALHGDFKTAQRAFGRASISGDSLAWMAALASAWSAQQQGHSVLRDRFLALAVAEQPEAAEALRLLQAQWLQAEAPEQAWQLVQGLGAEIRAVPAFAPLWYGLALSQGQADLALAQLDSKPLAAASQQYWLQQAGELKLQQLIEQSRAPDPLLAGWHNLPKALHSPAHLAQLVRALWALDAFDAAEQLLAAELDRHWDESLVDLYGRCRAADLARMQQQAERWLKKHPQSPALWRSLGRLSARQQAWAQARDQLQHSLELSASADSWALLAQVALQLSDRRLADQSYHQALTCLAQERS